jgi:hypothetical protein
MENEVRFCLKKQVFSETELAEMNRLVHNFSERFNCDLDESTIILPIDPKTRNFRWIVSSISHEYLHLILAELESFEAGSKLDNLGYNLATGCV